MPRRRNARPVVWAVKRYLRNGVRGTVIEVYPTKEAAEDHIHTMRLKNLEWIRRYRGYEACNREYWTSRIWRVEEYRL